MVKVDLSHYKGREPTYIKHCLLETYLPEWAYKVGTAWNSLAYVDGFAGPWQTISPEFVDSSFGIATDTLLRCQEGLRRTKGRELPMECILVDHDKVAFNLLKRFAERKTRPRFGVHALYGDFVSNIPSIEEILGERLQNPFRFVFLDPKGWADIPMLRLKSFLQGRSCEVLINLMTRHIIRFLDEPDRESSYNNLYGRKKVLPILRNPRLKNAPSYQRAELAVREYGRSLKLLCHFKYVSSAAVLEPDEESIRYFLVYASNHPRGVEVFKAAENKTAQLQEAVRYETKVQKTRQPGLAFDDSPPSTRLSVQLRRFYSDLARNRVIELLLKPRSNGLSYSAVFCEAMTFPLVTPDDLVAWLRSWEPDIKIVLTKASRKKPSALEEDQIFVTNPIGLSKQKSE